MTQYILSNQEMSLADQITIKNGIPSLELMKNAGNAIFKNLPANTKGKKLVICGPGNNGGDGFVVANLLINSGQRIDIYHPFESKDRSKDCSYYFNMINKNYFIQTINDLNQYDYVVDALFGTGLSRNISKKFILLFEKLNLSKKAIIAVDIPSGINGNNSLPQPIALKCSKTITFFCKKKCHFLFPSKKYCGEIIVEDIGISKDVYSVMQPKIKKNDPSLWIKSFPFPSSSDHKYSRGLLIINSGPKFQTGAARLAGRSALRVGAGAVRLVCDKDAAEVLEPQISVEMLSVISEKNDLQTILKDKKISSVLVGPGNGANDETKARTLLALALVNHVVIDADAISCFADNPDELFIDTYPHTILTPHEGEFKRLFGGSFKEHDDKVVRCVEAAKISGSIVLLKGADTVIADPDGNVVINSSQAPYLATAGSGDVLAGIIASLVGENKMSAFDAACAGAWIHSYLGEYLGAGLIAEDLIDNIPFAVKKLQQHERNN